MFSIGSQKGTVAHFSIDLLQHGSASRTGSDCPWKTHFWVRYRSITMNWCTCTECRYCFWNSVYTGPLTTELILISFRP